MNWFNKEKPRAPDLMPGSWERRWDVSGPLETQGVNFERPSYTPRPSFESDYKHQYNYPPYEKYSNDPSSPLSPGFKTPSRSRFPFLSPRRNRFGSPKSPSFPRSPSNASVRSGNEEWFDAQSGGRKRRRSRRSSKSKKRGSRRKLTKSHKKRSSRRRRSRH